MLRRIRGAIGMGIAWALAWAATGLLIGVGSRLLPALPWHLFLDIFDAPLPALAIPGFIGGAIFSVVLGVAARRRRFEELSIPRFAAWGAIGGVGVSLVPGALAALGLLHGTADTLWRDTLVIAVPFATLGATCAAGSLWLARRAEARADAGARDDATYVARGGDRQILGPGELSMAIDRDEAQPVPPEHRDRPLH